MIDNKSNVKKMMIVLALILVLISSMISFDNKIEAEVFEKIEISFTSESPFKITNLEGKTIIVDECGKISGTMDILKEETKYLVPNIRHVLTVRKSDKYIIEQEFEGYNHIAIDYLEDNNNMVILNTSNVCKAEIQLAPLGEINLQGNVQEYSLSVCTSSKSGIYDIGGVLYKPISLVNIDNKLVMNGVLGKVGVQIESADEKISTEGTYYLFGDETVLGFDAKKAYINNAVKLNTKEKKRIGGLYVRPANGNKNMFLTWTRVKKAKSYIVYQKDNKTGVYKKVAIRNGKGTNYYTAPITDDNVYAYKVMAKSKKNGKGKKIGKLSYGVKAVPMNNSKSNAESVVAGKKTISIKKGKKKKLKAKITHSAKGLLDKKLRWYSSNKKVAQINKNTGKLSAIKKGKCKVWAMAHNGKNSKKITVKVH